MFGYILALGIGLLLVAACFAGLGRAGPQPGRKTPGEKPVGPLDPAADEPTPDRSATASPREVAAARRHTPPA